MTAQKTFGAAEFFKVIAEEAIMGILAFDRNDGACLYSNGLAREMLEFSIEAGADQKIQLQVSDLFEPTDRPGVARGFKKELLEYEGLYQDILMRKGNGLPLITNTGIKHIMLDNGTPVLLIMFQDVTVQKKLQREVQLKQDEIHKAYSELVHQNSQLKELDMAKDRFLALTTHELRTPLSAIIATAEVLKLKLYEDEKQRQDLTEMVHEQSLHLMAIINDILDFAKIRAGKLEFFVEQLEMEAIVNQVVASFEQMAARASIKLEVEEPKEPLAAVWADALRMKEVLNNVVNNAIKYNVSGGRVTIAYSEFEGGFLRIAVTDTGRGIAPERIKSVFNEFETVESLSQHHKGTGLGMPISKRLMESIGGALSLESQVGKGTTFFIDIPTQKVLDETMYRSRIDPDADLAA